MGQTTPEDTKTVFRNTLRGGVATAATLSLLLAWAVPAVALTARALVDRTRVGPNDVLGLTVEVEGGDGTVDTSGIRDFDVQGRGRSSSVQIVNTHMTRQIRYQYALTPKRTGTLTVPPLPVIDGQDLTHTDPIVVTVAAAAASPHRVQDVVVEADMPRAPLYVGEQIGYTFRVVAAVKLYDAAYQEPDFDGFTAVKLGDPQAHTEVVNGRRVTVTEIVYLLTPQRSGSLTVGPAVLTCQVAVEGTRSRRRDPFGMFDDRFFGRVPVAEKVLRTRPTTVDVLALPSAPKGSVRFSGLVGTFSLSASLHPATVAAGESATLTLSLEGLGNVDEAGPPPVAAPDGLKVYPDHPETDTRVTPEGTRGTKRFKYALVPTRSGAFELGPFRVVTFDPEQGAYRTLTAGPLTLTASPGSTSTVAVPAPPMGVPEEPGPVVRKRTVEATGHDILDLHRGLDALTPVRTPETAGFAFALALPVILFVGCLWITTRRRQKPTPGERMARRARDLLSEVHRVGLAGKGASLLHRAVVSAVLARSGREGEALTYDEVRDELRNTGLPADAIGRVVDLLSRLDAARYGGGGGGTDLLTEGEQVVKVVLRGRKP